MLINDLPHNIRNNLEDALQLLEMTDEDLNFWEVSDYGIFVLMSEAFYKTLNFRKANPLDFIKRRDNQDLPHTGCYPDSRKYMDILINHFLEQNLKPQIIDVGGYIGRFSLESALLIKALNIDVPIHCLEPGLTRNIIKANFTINQVDELITLRSEAASGSDSTADYKYSPDGLISGRICSYPSASKHRSVSTIRLDSLISDINCHEAAIIKIDTEGHEPNVMAGLGSLAKSLPSICIVEFWPETLNAIINDMSYADFIERNFTVLNIRSSLYPSFYTPITDIRQFGQEFDFKEGNIDLLFINNAVKDADKLIAKLSLLGK